MLKLRVLILRSCGITFIDYGAFSRLQNLQALDLCSNNLDVNSTWIGVFDHVRFSLTTLDVSYNAFANSAQYPDKALGWLSKLEKLIINGIKGAKFGEGFKSLSNLQTLVFAPCYIDRATNTTFKVFNNLPIYTLSLSCEITYVESRT